MKMMKSVYGIDDNLMRNLPMRKETADKAFDMFEKSLLVQQMLNTFGTVPKGRPREG